MCNKVQPANTLVVTGIPAEGQGSGRQPTVVKADDSRADKTAHAPAAPATQDRRATPRPQTSVPGTWRERMAAIEKALNDTRTELAATQKDLAATKKDLVSERGARVAHEKQYAEDERVEQLDKAKQAKEKREKGWLKKALTELFMLFIRMFMPMISIISMIVQVLRVGYKVLVKREEVDWKREGLLFLGNLAGALPALGYLTGPVGFLWGAPLGGAISSAIHAGVSLTDEKRHDYLGWEKKEPSGLRVAWEKLSGLGSDVYGSLTGKERSSSAQRSDHPATETVRPAVVTTSS